MSDIPNELVVAVRALHFAATLSTCGLVVFWCVLAEPAFRHVASQTGVAKLHVWFARVVWIGLATVIGSGALWALLLAADFGGRPLVDVFTTDLLATVVGNTRFGNISLVRLGLCGLLAATLAASRDRSGPSPWRGLSIAAAAGLVGSLAWTGHGGATEGAAGCIHLIADVLHLCAAAAWLGGLLPLALVLRVARGAADETWTAIARDTTQRFSVLGLVSVGTLVATGAVNTWMLAGTIPGLLGTSYGRLLLLKIALFAAMLCLAAVNRLRLTPRLSDTRDGPTNRTIGTLQALERNSLTELGLGVIIVFIVGLLGTIPPALHMQPWWPFPLRLDGAIFSHPTLLYRTQAIFAVTASVAGVLSLAAAFAFRAVRLPLLLIGVLGVSFVPQCFRLLTVAAFPTSFHVSPTGYSVASIARGKDIFAEHCAACHGPDGRGEAALINQGTRPPDLTGDHIYAHRDGDLFWWITNGIQDAMPGFGETIDEEGRWALIDFLHANADAAHVRNFGAGDLLSVPIPDFTCEVSKASTLSTAQLRGQMIYILFASSRPSDRIHELAGLNLGDDVAKILVPLDPAVAEDLPVCIAREPAVPAVFASYRDGNIAQLDGTALIVDAAGFLRSMQRSQSVPAAALIRQIRGTPALPRSTIARMHSH